MLRNYLKIALRHLRRNGRYMLINVLGLGLALAFCILSFTNYRFAHSYDQWHKDTDRIFRVEFDKAGNHILHGTCPATLTEVAPADIPGVEAATRIDSRGLTVKQGENVFNEQVHFVDENFLDVFDFPLARGQARLNDRNALLITESMAVKFFGDQNPVGQQLTLYADEPTPMVLTISGVLKDAPKNSSIYFNFLTHLGNQLQADGPVVYDSWKWFVDAAFLRLRHPSDVKKVEQALQVYRAPQNQANLDWPVERYRLEPIAEMALHARDIRWNNLRNGTPPSSVWGNIVVAIMLLLTACLNFANTTIAIGNRRLREMGVRKVMGGTQGQLMRQLLAETFLICLIALALGMILATPTADWYNATWKHLDLHISYLDNPQLLLFLGITIVGTTLLAGAYPAFYISAFNPSSIFRGTLRFGGASLFTRIMMGMQVAISLMALVVGFSFANNAEVQRTADAGYNRQSLVGVELPNVDAFREFRDAIQQNPKVEAVAGTRHHIGFSFRRINLEYKSATEESMWLEAGKDYLPLVETKVIKGPGFSPISETASNEEVLVNETFAKEILQSQEPVGQVFTFDSTRYRIAGVVKDFMIDSPFDPVTPVIMHQVPEEQFRFCIVKTKPEDLHAVYANLEEIWKKILPYKPFNGFYQSEVIADALEVSENIANTMLVFSLAVLLLTISGLFAIVSLNALKMFRALAIRRVLGAKVGHISFQLNRNFLIVLFFSVIAGGVLGRIFALALMNSIYKIHAGAPLLVISYSALCMLLVLMLTAGVKVWQIWRMNLAEALKAE
ncbi:MAG: ABC transporter permease [Lewinellaceae bacterium]|nr:ABC transporter permease [Lewinellaceae bacterium]